jgi:hypothetical protein
VDAIADELLEVTGNKSLEYETRLSAGLIWYRKGCRQNTYYCFRVIELDPSGQASLGKEAQL